jgi:hypothetical protein
MTKNWIRMVHPSGQSNGGFTPCPNASWYDDKLEGRPAWYEGAEPCWMMPPDNWINGRVFDARTDGWTGWMHGVEWEQGCSDPAGYKCKPPTVALPAAAAAVVAEAGPRPGALRWGQYM